MIKRARKKKITAANPEFDSIVVDWCKSTTMPANRLMEEFTRHLARLFSRFAMPSARMAERRAISALSPK